jgi:beta-glucosidase
LKDQREVHKKVKKTRSFLVVASFLAFAGCASGGSSPMTPTTDHAPAIVADASSPKGDARPSLPASADGKARELVRRMTLEEKIAYIGGDRGFFIRPIPRLGIPEIKMSDGPAGCRNWGPNTTYPAAIAFASAFDPELIERVGHGIGHDCRARGVHILLAPGMNIQRAPLNGRNFEYLGEDPYLAGKTAAAFIRGVQGEGVLATAKHFAANNQEWDRNRISSEIDERTLREIYFPAFERTVREGRVASVMTAYNLLNGTYCSQHEWLLRNVLKGEWGFAGFVMSDWGAVHDGPAAANAGMDLEMPRAAHMNQETLAPLVAQNKIDVSLIDDKVVRILRTVIEAGFLDRAQKLDDIPLDDPKSSALALEAARSSIVLLKNAGSLLPLDRAKVRRIAVIGPNAHPAVFGGSGSAFVTPIHATSLLDGLKRAAANVEVLHHPGVSQSSEAALLGKPCFTGPVKETFFAGRELSGAPIVTLDVDRIDIALRRNSPEPAPGVGKENFSVRWTGTLPAAKKGKYRIVTNADDGIRVSLDHKSIVDDWHDHAAKTNAVTVDLAAGKHDVVIEYYQSTGGAVAQFGFTAETQLTTFVGGADVSALARKADVVIVSVGYGQSSDTNSVRTPFEPFWPPEWARQSNLVETENSDRLFELPAAQVETIRLAAGANPRTIVVMNAGGAVDLQGFLDKVPALLWAWYPGQEGGGAIADVLFGDVNPSGKLPITLGKRFADYSSAPYYQVNRDNKTPYTEGIFVGYRGFDAKEVEPAFAFGQGMSYTTFEYAKLEAAAAPDGSAAITLKVTNTGKRPGDEIVEVYVAPPKGAVPRAPRELRAFARVSLSPGETKPVAVTLEPRAFAFWDEREKKWKVDAGSFEILAGASSRDIRLRRKLEVKDRSLPP